MNAKDGLKQTLVASRGHEKEDSYAKNIFSRKEFLSVILKNVVPEYQDISKEEIMDLIEGDTIKIGTEEVSMDAQNTIRGESQEIAAAEEALSRFDVNFRALRPKVSGQLLVNLHIDLEIQGTYCPGYPIIKRGIYYGSRGIAKQLRKVKDSEKGYGKLEKVYSIWICVNDVPKKLQNTVSSYKFTNYKNVAYGRNATIPEDPDCDLMEVVIIRLGETPITENDMMEMLQGIFASDCERALKHVPQLPEPDEEEVRDMLMMSSYAEERGLNRGMEKGLQEGRKEGRKEGFNLFASIIKTIKLNSSWTDSQVAEHCGCEESEVKQVRKDAFE